MNRNAWYLAALGRLLLCGLFVWGGYGKLMAPGATAQYMASAGVPAPGLVTWVALAVELLGGIAILLGFRTRWAAAVLAIWSLGTGLLVHLPLGTGATDAAVAYDNMIHFYKNLGVAGGFLYVLAFGPGAFSIDEGWQPRR
jgi:putative oxidoreductase